MLCEGEPGLAVERELLGVPLLKFCLQLAEQWRLPSWIIHCYQLLLNDRRLLVKALHIARDNEHPLHQQQILDADERTAALADPSRKQHSAGQWPGPVGAPLPGNGQHSCAGSA